MRLTQLTEGPCDVAKPEEIEKMSGTEYDKYAQWKKDCEADERTTPLSTKRMSEKAKPDFLDLDKDGDKKEPMKSAGKQKKEVCEEPQVESYSDDYDLDSNWEDDYHGDMSQEEYDQEVDNSQMEYAVWVGGTEVNDKWLTYDEAITLYDKYKAQGYDDIKLDARIKKDSKEVTEILKPGSGPGAPKTGGLKLSPRRDLKKPLIHKPIKTPKSGYAESVIETDEEQLDEILPALAVGAAAAAVGTAAYKGGKAIGNWLAKKKTATADTLPGDGTIKKAGSALQNRNTQMSKNLAALKSESAFSKKVKEAADEDAEAVSARDDFVKMMSSRPKTPGPGKQIDTIKKIVADKQNMQVAFDDGKMRVDLYTASAVSQVYDAVKPETQVKIDNMLRTKAGMLKMSDFAFSKFNEDIQRIEEAREEGRLDEEQLDEILPVLAPLAWGAARAVGTKLVRKYGPKVAKAIANKFPKAGVKVADKVTKVGGNAVRNPNAGKWANTKAVGSEVWKKTPFKKTMGPVTAMDLFMPGNVVSNAKQVANNLAGTDKTSKDEKPANWRNNIGSYYVVDSVSKDDKLINEYTGEDGVTDKNGKIHDPNSSKGKTIINMKCNNPNVKDKTGCGTGIDKDKKRRRSAMIKKGVGLAKTGAKKASKAVGNAIVSTGFGNPLTASKYSPKDKSVEIMQKAMEQSMDEKGPGFNKAGIDKQKKQKSADHIGKKMDWDNLSPNSNINKVDKNEPWYNQGAFKKDPDNFKGYPDKWKTKK
jgi:hypothetical protein